MDNKQCTGSGTGLWLLRAGLLATAAVLIAFGISRGEMAIVLKKAVNLCLECIGLG